jgi:MFS family permease
MTEQEDIEYKSSYTWIFSINYFNQGLVTSILSVIIPIYILLMIAEGGTTVTPSDVAYIASIITIPWAVKLFFGIFADKYGLKNLGRRRPWILSALLISSVGWMMLPVMITPMNVLLIVTILGFIINCGTAFSDTVLDGFIIDICPKERLGRVQGFVWGLRSIGTIAGGPVLALLIVLGYLSVNSIFIGEGILTVFFAISILVVNEKKDYPEVMLKEHFKDMFNTSRDWKAYMFALANNVMGDVIVLFLAMFILIEMGVIELKGRNITLGEKTLEVYLFQANVTLIIAIGIVIGSILGGIIADKKTRKYAIHLGVVLTTASVLLLLIPATWELLLFFTVIIGVALGFRHSAYSAVVGQLAKKHPEMDSTYLSIANSFTNFGATLGLIITGLIFQIFGTYAMLFIFLAIISNVSLIPFWAIDAEDYEHKTEGRPIVSDIK